MDTFFEGQPQPMASYNDISSLPLIGDCIGMESCVDPMTEEDMIPMPCKKPTNVNVHQQQHEKKVAPKEFPPPISLLARTENLPAHMPWVLKREYTSDGRLVLTEERVRYHEYLKVHRENGRLTLQLVPLDHKVFGDSMHEQEDNCDEDTGEEDKAVLENGDNGDVVHKLLPALSLGYALEDDNGDGDHTRVRTDIPVDNGIGDGGKCLKYDSSVGLNSGCIFRVAVPAISPVL